tara:strand:- start:3621 stop:4064 length:444 start_codon:yes stop_codon:yes gene_type:complete
MYEVGQILYTILEKKHKVLPLKVVEQVVTKTLEGENIKYTLQLPNNKKTQVSIDKLSNIFVKIEDVKAKLTENANNAIEDMINSSNDLQDKFFSNKNAVEKLNIALDSIESINKESIEDHFKVDLGNGQVGKIKVNDINLNLDQKKT